MGTSLSAFALAGLIWSAVPVLAPAAAADQVNLIVSGLDKIVYLPVTLADRLGYFREQGLDVSLRSDPAGIEARDELLSGGADGVVGFYDHTIELQSKGSFVTAITMLSRVPGEVELAAPRVAARVKSSADFKDLFLGVTGLGSSTAFLTRYLAVSHGVPNRSFTLYPAGSGKRFIELLEQGRIDLGMTSEPTASRLMKWNEGVMVVDMRSVASTKAALGSLYPSACLYVDDNWLASHKSVAQRLASALIKALRFIGTHDAPAIAAKVPPDYFAEDKDVYIDALRASVDGFTIDGRMPPEGPESVLKILAAVVPGVRGAKIDLSRTFTNEFADAARQ